MYCVAAMVVLLAAAAFSPILEAQMRGVSRPIVPSRITAGPHFGARQFQPGGFHSFGMRPFGVRTFGFNPTFRHHRHFHFFFNSCFGGAFADPFFCDQFFFHSRFFFTQPVFLPYPVYSEPYYPIAEQAPATVIDREGDLAREVADLKDEVARLREEETSREQARQTTAQPPAQESTSAILIFRDGHQSEVRNYAIVGQTFWVLTEQRAHKIPVSDLDLEATKKVNADRGVEIRLP